METGSKTVISVIYFETDLETASKTVISVIFQAPYLYRQQQRPSQRPLLPLQTAVRNN